MANSTWKAVVGGDWNAANDWNGGLPGAATSVFVTVPGAYTITISQADSALAGSLLLNDANGTIYDAGLLTLGSVMTLTAGTFRLYVGGVVQGGTIADKSGLLVGNGGTLSGVAYDGTLNMSQYGASLSIAGGMTMAGAGGTGAGVIDLNGGQTDLIMAGGGTLDNATVYAGTTSGYAASLTSTANGGASETLTLGAHLVLNADGYSAQLADSDTTTGTGAAVVNLGTILAAATTSRLTISGNRFTNSGSITVSNGGYISITSTSFINTGTISESGGTISLGSNFTTAQIGTITTTDSGVIIAGTLTNTAATLNVSASYQLGGTILGGTILDPNGNLVAGGGTLTGVAYHGVLNLTQYNVALNIAGGMTLAGATGTGAGAINLTGVSDTLTLLGGGTLDNATVNIGTRYGNPVYLQSTTNAGTAETLTLGAHLLLNADGYTGRVNDSGYTGAAVVNLGTIAASSNPGQLVISGNNFINSGSITVSNGGSIGIASTSFTNTGTISESGGTLSLVSNLTTAQLGAITGDGGVVIAGTLTNTGATLSIPGGFQLSGTVLGGTIADSGGGNVFNNGTLSGVTYDGTLNLTQISAVLNIAGAITLAGAGGSGAGTVNLTGPDATLNMLGGGTLDNATINAGNTSGEPVYLHSTANGVLGETLTLGAHLLLDASSYGVFLSDSGAKTGTGAAVVNLGTIAATGTTGRLTISGNSVTNSGSIVVSNGGSLTITSAKFTNDAGATLTGGSYESDSGSTLLFQIAGGGSTSSVFTTIAANVTLNGVGSQLQVYRISVGAVAMDTAVTTIAATGALHVLGGRNLTGAVAFSDAGLLDLGGGTFTETSLAIAAGGTLSGFGTVAAPIAATGGIVAKGGLLKLAGAVTGAGGITINAASTLEVGNVAATETVSFAGTGATLKLDTPASFAATLANLAAGDTIDVTGSVYTTVAVTASGLTLSNAASTQLIRASGATGNRFELVSDGNKGTDVIAFRTASASVHTPEPVAFGNVHVGAVQSLAVSITNTAAADGYSENLDATLSTTATGFTATGGFSGLAAGATGTLTVGLTATSIGAISGTATIALASDGTGVDSLGTVALAPQTVTVTASVYALAAPALSIATLNFGATRVGAASLTQATTLSNGSIATPYQESLLYSTGVLPSAFSGGGSGGTVLAGGTAGLNFYLGTATAGDFTGSQLALNLASTGTGTSGLADTTLASPTLTLNGKVYATAAPVLSAGAISFGVVHVGDTVPLQAVSLSNAASGALTDSLIGSYAASAGFTGGGSVGTITAGGSVSLGFGLVTTTSGAFSGTGALTLASHDADQSDATVSAGPVTLSGTVDNYALAVLQALGGAGTLGGSGTALTLNLGSIATGTVATETLDVANGATGLADLLSGGFTVTNASGAFTNTGFGTTAFSGLGAGQASGNLTIALSSTAQGTFSETIVLNATGSNANYSGTLTAETLTVTGTVTSSTTTITLGTTAGTYLGTGGNDIFIAAGPGTLLAADKIDGLGGTNTLQLTGAGAFNLGTPATLANIQVVTAQEGQAAYTSGKTKIASTLQTVTLRAGLNVTLNVLPATLNAANPNPAAITIIGNKDSSVINLGAGQDTVTLGAATETVNGGSGNDTYNLTAATAGATIAGGSGTNTLNITGGGAVTLGADTGSFTAVLNDPTTGAQAPYVFNAGSTASVQVIGGNGGDTIKLGSATQSVTEGGNFERVVVTAASAGALVTGLGIGAVLEVSGGGTAVLNTNTDNVTVQLDAATNLTLGRMAFETAVGSSGADTITAGASGQVLSGGLGADTLVGLVTHGITFKDTAAGLTGDTLVNFGVGDLIDITNMRVAAAGFKLTATGSAPTTLAVTDGTHSASITLSGAFNDAHFVTAADGHGGLAITYTGP